MYSAPWNKRRAAHVLPPQDFGLCLFRPEQKGVENPTASAALGPPTCSLDQVALLADPLLKMLPSLFPFCCSTFLHGASVALRYVHALPGLNGKFD